MEMGSLRDRRSERCGGLSEECGRSLLEGSLCKRLEAQPDKELSMNQT